MIHLVVPLACEAHTFAWLLMQLWEQLLFDSAIKERLLSYATSALLFADRGVAPAVVGINRVALLHGCAPRPALQAQGLACSCEGSTCMCCRSLARPV